MNGNDDTDSAAAVWLRQVGRRVRLARLTAEMTQEELGQRTGISRSFISLIEHGAHDVSVLRLWHIADVLGVRLVDLLDGTGPRPAEDGDR